jgi:hypothetical protein
MPTSQYYIHFLKALLVATSSLFFNKWRFCSPLLNWWWLFSLSFSRLWWFGLCRSCRLLELGTWPSRARESSLFVCVWRPRSAFSGCALWCLGSTASDLLLGASGDSACRTRAAILAKLASLLHCRWLVLGISACDCVFPMFILYNLFLYCLNFTEIYVG